MLPSSVTLVIDSCCHACCFYTQECYIKVHGNDVASIKVNNNNSAPK